MISSVRLERVPPFHAPAGRVDARRGGLCDDELHAWYTRQHVAAALSLKLVSRMTSELKRTHAFERDN